MGTVLTDFKGDSPHRFQRGQTSFRFQWISMGTALTDFNGGQTPQISMGTALESSIINYEYF